MGYVHAVHDIIEATQTHTQTHTDTHTHTHTHLLQQTRDMITMNILVVFLNTSISF